MKDKTKVKGGMKRPSGKGKSSAGSPGLTKPSYMGGAKARNETGKMRTTTPRASMK